MTSTEASGRVVIAPQHKETHCRYCKAEIDPDVCWCGDYARSHGRGDGHVPMPMGCVCHLKEQADAF